MNETPTSYSLLLMHKDIIYAVRDPYGNRPLCIGRLVPVGDMNGKGKSYVKLMCFTYGNISIITTAHKLCTSVTLLGF